MAAWVWLLFAQPDGYGGDCCVCRESKRPSSPRGDMRSVGTHLLGASRNARTPSRPDARADARPEGSLHDGVFGCLVVPLVAVDCGLRGDSPPTTRPDYASLRPWVRHRIMDVLQCSNAVPPCVAWDL